jgi:hypothetical protein
MQAPFSARHPEPMARHPARLPGCQLLGRGARSCVRARAPREEAGPSAGLAGTRVTWCGWQRRRRRRRRHRCARAAAAQRSAERAETRSREGAGRRGGAAGPRVGRVSGERRGARPGCNRGRSAQGEPAPRSAFEPRALSISRGTETKEDSCPKVGLPAGPSAPAGRRLRTPNRGLRCYQGEGCSAQEPTRGDICMDTRTHGGTHLET